MTKILISSALVTTEYKLSSKFTIFPNHSIYSNNALNMSDQSLQYARTLLYINLSYGIGHQIVCYSLFNRALNHEI